MATTKKWSVTYTKHVKQKRKVYQDGFLTFESSSNKVMLCDSSEKMLECRLLKSDEVVRSGETLMFNAYLVDVGDLEGEDWPFNGVNSYSCATNIDGLNRKETIKYGMLSKSPDSVPTTAEWHVLYTAQLTQKAKKYHDGYLRFTNSGSLNIQVQLYDENWSLLDSQFMNKTEEVKPGEKMTFQAHAVEVVEPRENHGNSMSLDTARNGKQSFQQLRAKNVPNDLKLHKPVGKEEKGVENTFSSPKSNFTSGELIKTEWQVLYTAQVTKKAKMYQDGFMQHTIRGSLGRQTGKSIAFDGYLVDIGAPEGQGEILVDLGNEVVHGYDNTKKHVNFSKPVIRQSIHKGSINGPAGQLSGRNLEKASSVGDCSSNAEISIIKEAEQTGWSTGRKPLRDTSQILSILRDPCSEKVISPSSDANKGVSDSLDNSTKPASNGVSSIEIVDIQTSELAVGCTENHLSQTLQVQNIDELCYDNESSPQDIWCDPTSSHSVRHSDEMSMLGPIKTDPEMQIELPSFDLGF